MKRRAIFFNLIFILICLASCNTTTNENLTGEWTMKDTTNNVSITFTSDNVFTISPNNSFECSGLSYYVDQEKNPAIIHLCHQKIQPDSTLKKIDCAFGTFIERYKTNFYLDIQTKNGSIKGLFEKQNQRVKWFNTMLTYIIPPKHNEPKVVSYNFGYGLLHGFFIFFSLIAKIFGFKSGWYAANTDWTYLVGFILGILIFILAAGGRK